MSTPTANDVHVPASMEGEMPYTVDSPPESIKGLPKHAIEIWVSAFNAALKEYGDDTTARKVAWGAVKEKYKQDEDGEWQPVSKALSLDGKSRRIYETFNIEFGSGDMPKAGDYVHEIFDDDNYIIVSSGGDGYYKVSFTRNDGAITFGSRATWTKVKQTWSDDVEKVQNYKTEGGVKFGPSAFLVHVGNPSEWKLRVEESPGKVTVAQLGRAAAALGPGFRGQRVQLSPEQRKAAAKRLISLYNSHDADPPSYLYGIAGMKAPAKKAIAKLLESLSQLVGLSDINADELLQFHDDTIGDGLVEKNWEVQIEKTVDERRLVYGVVLKADEPDLQGDVITEAELEKAAHRFMVKSRGMDHQHIELLAPDQAVPVESFIAHPGDVIYGRKIEKASWLLGTYVPDDVLWERIRTEKIRSYSIRGYGKRVPLAT